MGVERAVAIMKWSLVPSRRFWPASEYLEVEDLVSSQRDAVGEAGWDAFSTGQRGNGCYYSKAVWRDIILEMIYWGVVRPISRVHPNLLVRDDDTYIGKMGA